MKKCKIVIKNKKSHIIIYMTFLICTKSHNHVQMEVNMKIRYFDNAATTKVRDEVLKEMMPYFSIKYGNPSAIYSIGRESKRGIDKARESVARAIGCDSNEIYFTSCGSESDNLAIKGVAYANRSRGNHIITSKIEHHAVLDSCRSLEKEGFKVTYINVDENGTIDINQLIDSICDKTILISIMFANNEIGTIQPINKIGEIAKSRNIIFHTDAVQAIGNIKIDVKKLNIDLLSMSGHKFYAPKGIGALYIRKGVKLQKLQDGGHQERDKRAGTENIAQIVGLGKAIELIDKEYEEYNQSLRKMRDYYVEQVEKTITNVKLNGDRKNRLSGNANISFEGVDAQNLLLKLDEVGICASVGSACSTGESLPSHVLTAIGLNSKMANSTLRVSFGKYNTKEDVEYLIENLRNIVKEIRKN